MDRRVVPARQHVLRRLEAHGVVHDGRAAHAAALEHRETEILGLLEHAVGVEFADHPDFVLGDGARLDVAASLHDEHLATRLR